MALPQIVIAALIAQAPAAPAPDSAPPVAGAAQCQKRITARLGEVGNFDVRDMSRRGSRVILSGTLTAQQRPATAPPGMMTAMHIINASYSFECSLRHGRVTTVKLKRTG